MPSIRQIETTTHHLSARDVATMLADRIEPLVHELLPGGRREGQEFRVGSIAGEPGQSLGIRLTGRRRASGATSPPATAATRSISSKPFSGSTRPRRSGGQSGGWAPTRTGSNALRSARRRPHAVHPNVGRRRRNVFGRKPSRLAERSGLDT